MLFQSMERLTVGRYIEKMILKTRTKCSDDLASSMSTHSRKSQAEHAQDEAGVGFTETTASFLSRDNVLSIGQKGEILANAYTIRAQGEIMASHQREVEHSDKAARGLTRAVHRLHKY